MNTIRADVLRVLDTKPAFQGGILKDRMFGFTLDTHEFVAMTNGGAYDE
ncbi:MAG: hypothetical protein LBC59_09585 [Chitinispirillales bacterium]|jgi:hypothetical protein|nr:hypothetical protein [Chitinispirillales bacterium]